MRASYTMAFAALAIRGHKSAHSFAIGPVIADPANPKESKKLFSITQSGAAVARTQTADRIRNYVMLVNI